MSSQFVRSCGPSKGPLFVVAITCALWAAADVRGALVWTQIGLDNQPVKSLAFAPGWPNDRTMLATDFFYGSFFRSLDGGVSWQTTQPWGPVQTNMNDVVFSPGYVTGGADQRVFVAGGYPIGAARSINAGTGFIASSYDTSQQPWVYELAISATFATDNTILAASSNGVLKSSNGGQSYVWSNGNLPFTNTSQIVISPNYAVDKTLFVGTFGSGVGVYKSTNGGLTWSPAGALLPSSPYFSGPNIMEMAISPNYAVDQTLFVTIEDKGPWRSTDGGVSWSSFGGWTQWRDSLLALSPNYGTDRTVLRNDDNGQFVVSRINRFNRYGVFPAWPNQIVPDPDFASQRVYIATNDGIWMTHIPEPAGIAISGLGAGLLVMRRRRRADMLTVDAGD